LDDRLFWSGQVILVTGICPVMQTLMEVVIAIEEGRELPLADVPIPQNIKDFELIRLRFVFTIKICSLN
jgi:hypothetical protein